jgi:hypothetical protein
MKKHLSKIWLTAISILYGIQPVFAQQSSNRPPIVPAGTTEQLYIPTTPSGQVEENFIGGNLLPSVTKTVIAAAGATAILFIIVGGIQILTAYGVDEKINKGKKTITFAIVGLLIAILSYAIVSIISGIRLQ